MTRRSRFVFVALFAVLGSGPVLAQSFERNTDRPGADYTSFDINGGPSSCERACMREYACRAWTYVRAGFQGPGPRCWLKSGVPAAQPSDCCVSGVR